MTTEKTQTVGLIIASFILLACLVIGNKISNKKIGVDIGQALETDGLQIDRTGLPDYQPINNNIKEFIKL